MVKSIEQRPRLDSDVPELMKTRDQEDQEVIKVKEIPLHEELGFATVGEMEAARNMERAIADEKDQTKVAELRSKLEAMLNDGDAVDNSAVKTRVLERTGNKQAERLAREANIKAKYAANTAPIPVDSPEDQVAASLEFNRGLQIQQARAEIEQSNDAEEISGLKGAIRFFKKYFLNPLKGSDETRVEQIARERIATDAAEAAEEYASSETERVDRDKAA